MSSRRHLLKVLGLVAALGLLMGLSAEIASAKLSQSQKAAIRASLNKQIKKNPGAFFKRSFVRKASLVDFKLPVTIRVRDKFGPPPGPLLTTNAAGGNNRATIDLGSSLGTRTIGLGGHLPAEVRFHDSFEGGALGNVDLALLPSTAPAMGLTTTSVPLLTNTDVTSQVYNGGVGCSGWTSGDDPLGQTPGVDDPALLTGVNNNPGLNNLGEGPYGLIQAYSPQQVVLRTGSLNLDIADPGTLFQIAGGGSNQTQDITIGKSGGQANLFSNIPGKNTQVDVTASLATTIHSLARVVNPTANTGGANFKCRQAWTGGIFNVLSGVRLTGSLKISPAILADGKLRLAKAVLSTPPGGAASVHLAACLYPYEAYAAPNPAFNPLVAPGPANSPIDSSIPASPEPTGVACNATPNPVLQSLGATPLGAPGTGYTSSSDGSRAIVSGDLTVNDLHADIIIGGNQT